MKLAAAAYPLTAFSDWSEYETKLSDWVSDAANQGAELLVFPEYGAMELASLADTPMDEIEAAMQFVNGLIGQSDRLHSGLARQFNVHILAGSAPVYVQNGRPVNRARLFDPDGRIAFQDKQVMTMVERGSDMDVHPGGPLQVFDTALGRIGVLICYDVEFPLLGRRLMELGVQILLAPSYTEGASGYWRVRIGAMARALEGQCITLHAPCLHDGNACVAMGGATGAAGIFGPPDLGFPDDGVIALGEMGKPGWVVADIAADAVDHVRQQGRVRNFDHWSEQLERLQPTISSAAE